MGETDLHRLGKSFAIEDGTIGAGPAAADDCVTAFMACVGGGRTEGSIGRFCAIAGRLAGI